LKTKKVKIINLINFNLYSVQSALVGELPSFGMATESKFQHLMHHNTAGDPPSQLRPPQSSTNASTFNNFDTNLSLKAKPFRPNQGWLFNYLVAKIFYN